MYLFLSFMFSAIYVMFSPVSDPELINRLLCVTTITYQKMTATEIMMFVLQNTQRFSSLFLVMHANGSYLCKENPSAAKLEHMQSILLIKDRFFVLALSFNNDALLIASLERAVRNA